MKRFLTTGMVAAAVAGVVVTGQSVRGAEPTGNPHQWKSRVSSVTVFKNGLGFFLREGEVTLRDGWCAAEAVPPAAFGTLAIYSHAKDEVVDLVGSGPGEVVEFDGTDAPADIGTKRARLEACLRLKVQLTYTQKDTDRTAAGRLVSVGPDYAVLEADSNSFAVPVAGIRTLQVLELPLRVHVGADNGRRPERTTLGMAYLRKGVTWIPEYTLKLLDETTAELTLRGTLVNEAEDLVHCDVNFVVGVPGFFHTDYLAPVAVGQVIRTIGAAVAPREVMTQLMNRAAVANDMRSDQFAVTDQPVGGNGRTVNDVLGTLPQWESAGASDFTVYTRKDLTLRRGEKAIVTLFVKKIQYGHLYRWSPPGSIEHFLVLRNDTDSAWTTGPCLAVSQGNALSENLLKYVPKGGRGELPVTTAINLAQDQKEEEVDRQLKAHELSHNFFVDLVTLQGELKVRNFGTTTAELIVEAAVTGKPVSATDDGRIILDPTKLQLLERNGRITWTTRVEPGETKLLGYRYERYVPSH